MKAGTIKALKELCGNLMRLRSFPGPETDGLIANSADRLDRVLDEELGAQQRPPKVIAVNHETEST